ncbi:cyclodeaminase/cyclohydrolase family protein [Micrococcus yunnanensis]|uniref:Formiminotetrahydrofolate cyclodeaminase n=1 Tax=Micrococcus yunnanensis TaxID=566027 RepID=A0ABR6CXM9_9MICC|nr:cyclodeaminase/cyclohydrolase family protein [Micrococcus yunnanensis]MCT1815159.1 cyclodeaminase/cyclohydrolase family protein [Micrococcus luteus]TFI18435.1 methenyltetrahydrofolate cyclohydrolase [Thiopseudomonas sp. 4R-3cl]MBA9058508.1 formiminotetrahydrofolate cyclodeaminase [Micrococcus yunnanensis]MCT1869139.1 cyclodeaminase/cyclohydrolase family protein [Micrococcus luteus]MCV7459015.1 cyclodeaminase/cyclohydrolase family protein [Micrococcus luteus]
MIRDESIESYLGRLASGEPTPGGGATGALAVAEGAGLLAMAARFSAAEEDARASEGLIAACLGLADGDERGFGAVAEAFGLPRDTPEDRARRSAAIQAALAEAVRPPRGIVDVAERALDLAERVLDAANPNVLSDVGAALGCVRGGLTAAAVTLETNLGPLRDEGLEGVLRIDVDRADRLVARADALLGRVRAAVTG